jgi:hypothetical protein
MRLMERRVRGAGADSTGVVCCAGEVVAVVVDGNGAGRKMRVGVPTIGEKRRQWRTVLRSHQRQGSDAQGAIPRLVSTTRQALGMKE